MLIQDFNTLRTHTKDLIKPIIQSMPRHTSGVTQLKITIHEASIIAASLHGLAYRLRSRRGM